MNFPSPLLLVLVAALAGCQPPPPRQALQPDELKQQLRSLASLAAEGGMLARQVGEGRVPAGFAWVEQQGLSEDAMKASADLARPAPASLSAAQADAMRLASALALDLNRVAGARHDANALRALAGNFDALATQAQKMEQAL